LFKLSKKNLNSLNSRKNKMRTKELIIFAAFGVIVAYALTTTSFDSVSSFNPLNWVTDSISGFLNLLKDLFFG
jgi:hypothetical protein